MHPARTARRALLIVLALSAPAFPATFAVTKIADTADGACDADCSLREAVIAANAAPDADVVDLTFLTGARTYALSVAGDGDASVGDLDVTHPVRIQGISRSLTVVDAAALGGGRVFSLQFAGDVTFANMTIRNGAADTGGCVKNTSSNATFLDATLRGCAATSTQGGGAFENASAGSRATFVRSTVRESTATNGLGGGIRNLGNLTLLRTNVTQNTAKFGGAIFSTCPGAGATFVPTVALYRATVDDNTAAQDGGGIVNSSSACLSALDIDRSIFSGNQASAGAGGAIITRLGDLSIRRTLFENNQADGPGGAIYATSDPTVLEIENSTFDGNVSVAAGSGALAAGSGHDAMSVTNCTFRGNEGVAGIGGSRQIAVGSPAVSFRNTVVDATQAGAPACWTGSSILSEGGNLSDDASCKFDGPDDAENASAMLGPLTTNGGQTRTRAPDPGSPAIGAGVSPCPAEDQRGYAREAACDAGAHETGASSCPGSSESAAALLSDILNGLVTGGVVGDPVDPGDVTACLGTLAGL